MAPRFHKHPIIEGAYLLERDSTRHPVTFRPEVFDAHPNTLKLLTYGQSLLDDLLQAVPQPISSEGAEARVVRCSTDTGELVAFYPSAEDGPAAVESLGQLRKVLTTEPSICSDARINEVVDSVQRQAHLVQGRARGVREDLAVGDYLARQEEARLTLRRAAFLDMALQNHRGLLDDEAATQFSVFGSVRDFARTKGYPYAPLVKLLDNEDIPLAVTDPYLASLDGKTEKSLRGKKQVVKEQAQDVLKRLMVARERVQKVQSEEVEPTVVAQLLR